MENFEPKYEAQKIPELYNLYFNYQAIKEVIAQTKSKIKGNLQSDNMYNLGG